MNDDHSLPVRNDDSPSEDLPSCSPKIYVSNEETSLLAAMRSLREKSLEVRQSLTSAGEQERHDLEAELTRMREEWKVLAERREEAFRNKMIALGHLPPTEY